jgi:hypothetical protein
MTKQQHSNGSLGRYFWAFIAKNPELAAGIAFELGALVATAVHGDTAARLRKSGNRTIRSLSKSAHNVQDSLAKAMPEIPDLAKLTGLSFLPGPAPKLQPRKRPPAKRKTARKAAT